ncbi:MAG: efflux RND transporter periplasmic adaptor subunit [Nannocystaceae bacterium]
MDQVDRRHRRGRRDRGGDRRRAATQAGADRDHHGVAGAPARHHRRGRPHPRAGPPHHHRAAVGQPRAHRARARQPRRRGHRARAHRAHRAAAARRARQQRAAGTRPCRRGRRASGHQRHRPGREPQDLHRAAARTPAQAGRDRGRELEEIDTAELDAEAAARELDAARFAARVARYEVETAKAALARSSESASTEQFEIRSPIVGTVLRIMRESEGVVTAGTPLMEVADPRAIEIVVDVLTADAVEIEPGDLVEIQRWGGAEALRGHVRLVAPSAFTKVSSLGVEEQRVDVIIRLDEPYERWQALGDGYAVVASIVVWEQDDAVTVPTAALVRSGDTWGVFVVEDGTARLRPVTVGKRGALAVQVTEGVRAGETLVLHPSDRIRDGVAVAAL